LVGHQVVYTTSMGLTIIVNHFSIINALIQQQELPNIFSEQGLNH
jgi:hypothetical protein